MSTKNVFLTNKLTDCSSGNFSICILETTRVIIFLNIVTFIIYVYSNNQTTVRDEANLTMYLTVMMFCCGGEFLSVMLNSLQWNRVPSILPMRTKSQGNEVILSTFNHFTLNKNNTTTHQVQIVKIQNQKSIKLS